MENTKRSSLNILAAVLLCASEVCYIASLLMGEYASFSSFGQIFPAAFSLLAAAFVIGSLFIGKRRPITGAWMIVYAMALIYCMRITSVSTGDLMSFFLDLLPIAALIVSGALISDALPEGEGSGLKNAGFLPPLLAALPILGYLVNLVCGLSSVKAFILALIAHAALAAGLFYAQKWAAEPDGDDAAVLRSEERRSAKPFNIIAGILLSVCVLCSVASFFDLYRHGIDDITPEYIFYFIGFSLPYLIIDAVLVFSIVMLFIGRRRSLLGMGIGLVACGGISIIYTVVSMLSLYVEFNSSLIIAFIYNLLCETHAFVMIIAGVMAIKMFRRGIPTKLWYLPALMSAASAVWYVLGMIADYTEYAYQIYADNIISVVVNIVYVFGFCFAMKWAARICPPDEGKK